MGPPAPDTDRVILHFDVDCFYAQCEELRDPGLKHRPLAVTQKYLVVTCNYPARERGVTKLMNTSEAQRRCPELALVSGEDLTPYRRCSKALHAVLRRYGTAERLGLDEIWVDATAEVERRLHAAAGGVQGDPSAQPWCGHVLADGAALVQDSRHRPMDLRAAPAQHTSDARPAAPSGDAGPGAQPAWEARLRMGSALAQEARAALRAETGVRASAGVACNRMLAKLISGIHKPDQQTVLLPPHAAAFVAPLPVRALPGVGAKMESELAAAGMATVADLRALPDGELARRCGDRAAAFLDAARWGRDSAEVVERGPPASVTVEDSFKSAKGHAAAGRVLAVLAPDLLARLQEEEEDSGRRAATLVVKWRLKGQGWNRSSASCPMPRAVVDAKSRPEAERAAALQGAAAELLAKHLQEPFDLTLLNLGATKFAPTAGGPRAAASGSILDLMRKTGPEAPAATNATALEPTPAVPPTAALAPGAAARSEQLRRDYGSGALGADVMSKRAERQLREGPAHQPLPAGGVPANAWGGHCVAQGADEDDEDLDVDLWRDLAQVSDWRADRPGSAHSAQQQHQQRQHHCSGAVPGAFPGAPATSASAQPTAGQGGSWSGVNPAQPSRVVIHCDIDAFYCSVERLDDPSLRGVPLAVEQFNSGGFVAVSYEARAAGIRCGDGAGAAGRASVPHLVRMKARSLEECRAACPGLQVRRMRPQRYRQVGAAVHAALRRLVGGGLPVEKASCDDFYLDLSTLCLSSQGRDGALGCSDADLQAAPPGCSFVPSGGWASVAPDLQRGAWAAHRLKLALHSDLGLSASFGVARSRLVARLASPTNKPDGLTVVSDAAAALFVRSLPLRSVPSLQGSFGAEVHVTLGIEKVEQLLDHSEAELLQRFGAAKGAFLAGLPHAVDPTPVRERGPQKTLACERSFPPAKTEQAVLCALRPLAAELLPRLMDDHAEHARLPNKLAISWRQGYAAGARCRSAAVPPVVLDWVRGTAADDDGTAADAQLSTASEACAEAAMALLRADVAGGQWEVTRLALGVQFSAHEAARPASGQAGIAGYFNSMPPAEAALDVADTAPPAQPPPPSRAAAAVQQVKVAATYRNAEALAVQRMFSGGSSGEELKIAGDTVTDEDQASLALALALQREEVAAAAAGSRVRSSNCGKRKVSGPLDAFVRRRQKQ